MKHTLTSTIVCILLETVRCQFHCSEVNLINRLNHFYGFHHNIFLLDSLTDTNQCIPARDNKDGVFVLKTVYILDHNARNNIQWQQAISESVTSDNTFLIIVAHSERFECDEETQLWVQVQDIVKLRRRVKIGVFFSDEKGTSMDILELLFLCSWKFGIVNIVCAFYSNSSLPSLNVFRFDPFGMFNVTDDESLQNYFGENVRTRLVYGFVDTTRVFIKLAICPAVNASNRLESRKYNGINNSFVDQEFIYLYDVGMNELARTYPHRVLTYVLLVPHAQPYSGFLEYLANTTWKRIFAYTLVVIMATSLVLTLSGYLRSKKILFLQSVADVINLLINDNGTIKYGQLHRVDACILVPLTFAGLIAVNGIFSVFQSYLSFPIYEHQIRTIDNLFNSEVPFLTSEYQKGMLESENRTIELLENVSRHGAWNKKMRTMPPKPLYIEKHSLNNSIAFYIDYISAKLLLEVQKRLNRKVHYLIPELVVDKVLCSFYYYQQNQPFWTEPVNSLIHRLQSAGLIYKWFDDFILKDTTTMSRQFEKETNNETNGGEFAIPTIIWCGWIASVMFFICEIIWMKIRTESEKLSNYF